MTRARRNGQRLRRWILVVGIFYVVAGIAWLFLPLANNFAFDEFGAAGLLGTPLGGFASDVDEWTYVVEVSLFLGVLLFLQWMYLRPGSGWLTRFATTGRSLTGSVIAAAAMAMLLSVGLIALVLEVPDLWEPLMDDMGYWGIGGVWVGMLVIWGLWAWVFYVYWRQGDQYTRMGRIIRGLVGGSLLEILVAVPAHILVMRQRDCYCLRGTYTTLVFAGIVLLWAFGPGVVLLFLRERYRCERLFPSCVKCGYSLRGNLSGVCPECGTPIDEEVGQARLV